MANLLEEKRKQATVIAIGAASLLSGNFRDADAAILQEGIDFAGPSSSVVVQNQGREKDTNDKGDSGDSLQELAGPSIFSSGPTVRELAFGDADRVRVLSKHSDPAHHAPVLEGPYDTEIRAYTSSFSSSPYLSILVNVSDVPRVNEYLKRNYSGVFGFSRISSLPLDKVHDYPMNATIEYGDTFIGLRTAVTPHEKFLDTLRDVWKELDEEGIASADQLIAVHYNAAVRRVEHRGPSRGTIDKIIIKDEYGERLSGIYRQGEVPESDHIERMYGRASDRTGQRHHEIEIIHTSQELPAHSDPGVVHMFVKNGDGVSTWIPVHLEYGTFSSNFYPLDMISRSFGFTYLGQSGWIPSAEQQTAVDIDSGMAIEFSSSYDYYTRRYGGLFGPKDVKNTRTFDTTVHVPAAEDFHAYVRDNDLYNVRIERIILPTLSIDLGAEYRR